MPKPKVLTSKDIERYLRNDTLCPYCGSGDLYPGPIISHPQTKYESIRCRACGEEWRDVYRLTNIALPPDRQPPERKENEHDQSS